MAAARQTDAFHTPAAPVAAATPARTGADPVAAALLALGLAALYIPTFWDLNFGIWTGSGHGQEPLIVVVSAWLAFRRRHVFAALPDARSRLAGSLLMAVGLLVYVVGRTQGILRFEVGSMLIVAAAIPVCLKGGRGLRVIWFALFFLCFAVPMPNEVVLMLTAPMKAAVSAVAVWMLSLAGYSVGRSGVVMTIGQYQLLVTEACAGLQTLFTLEAVGLLYANVMNYRSVLRNGLLAVLVVPISFTANVIRVAVLALVTYHFGDEAGQGFIHRFAGLVLFAVALAMLVGLDRVLGRVLPQRHRS